MNILVIMNILVEQAGERIVIRAGGGGGDTRYYRGSPRVVCCVQADLNLRQPLHNARNQRV